MISFNLDIFIDGVLDFFVQFVIVFIFIFILAKARGFFVGAELRNGEYYRNIAIAILSIGYFLASVIVITSSLQGFSAGYLDDLILITMISSMGILFVLLNRLIIPLLFFNHINIEHEIERENVALAIFFFGAFLSTSYIFYQFFAGVSFNLSVFKILLPYFIITQIAVYLFVKMAILTFNFDIIRELQRGNIAVSIEAFSLFIFFTILFSSIPKDFFQFNIEHLAIILVYFIIWSVFIMFLPTLITSIIITGNRRVERNIEDGNILIAIHSGLVKIVLAILITQTIPFKSILS
jgi:uncharacterized membrane protein YjfL (UPF0719 family)